MLESLNDAFSSVGFMPHIHCYLGKPALVWTMFVTDLLIGIAYVGISMTLWGLIRKIKIPFSLVVLCFGVFIGACGATHFMEVYTLWNPDYWFAAWLKILTAIASVGTGIYLYRLRGPLIQVAEAAKLSEQRQLDLEVLTDTLEHRVAVRTQELNVALKTRDDFLSVASHEFRTPITALKLKLELSRRMLAKEEGEVAQKFSKFTQDIDSQINRLSKLVEDLLDLSRVRAGNLSLTPEKFNLSVLLSESLEKFSSAFQENHIELKLDLEPGIEFYGDSLRFEQVFMNLASNVVRYASDKPLSVSLKKKANAIELMFQDHGPGIPSGDVDRIFNRFERLEPKNHVQGMGVGLFITQAIVEAHHGTIEAVSNPLGARFVIHLPLTSEMNSLDSVIPVSDTK
jgi:signal transduction histidine kinase